MSYVEIFFSISLNIKNVALLNFILITEDDVKMSTVLTFFISFFQISKF
jgi:hypothetical protein